MRKPIPLGYGPYGNCYPPEEVELLQAHIAALESKLCDITENYVICERDPFGYLTPTGMHPEFRFTNGDMPVFRPRQEPKEPQNDN
jgi:hypothetical protein